MIKFYRDSRFGQLHWHAHPYLAQDNQPQLAPLLCLHPAPYSGGYFDTFAPLATHRRTVVAPDYPGYGESSLPRELPSIAGYAGAIADTLSSLSPHAEGPMDLLGFHTGALVALELALQCPDKVGELILVDVPYFTEDAQQSLYPKAVKPTTFSADLSCLEARWSFNVGGERLDSMPLARALSLFTQELLSGEQSHWAFHAAFTYPCEAQFGALKRPCNIIATQSGLLEPTRAAARKLANVTLIERLDVTRAVFEDGAGVIAEEVLRLTD